MIAEVDSSRWRGPSLHGWLEGNLRLLIGELLRAINVQRLLLQFGRRVGVVGEVGGSWVVGDVIGGRVIRQVVVRRIEGEMDVLWLLEGPVGLVVLIVVKAQIIDDGLSAIVGLFE